MAYIREEVTDFGQFLCTSSIRPMVLETLKTFHTVTFYTRSEN